MTRPAPVLPLRRAGLGAAGLALLVGCGGASTPPGVLDASADAGGAAESDVVAIDAGAPDRPDAGSATVDTPRPDAPPIDAVDAAGDAPIDGPVDVPIDIPIDTPVDVPIDAPIDGPVDVAADAPVRCASNAACAATPARPVCDVASGSCVACTVGDPGACAATEHCDVATHACVPGCRSDEGCPATDGGTAGRRCDVARNACVECTADDHCGAGRVCAGNVCVAGCNATHACEAGRTCCAGACVDVQSSAANCGGCGTACTVANGAPACASGACAVAACTSGYGNCNGSASDGCETNLNTTVSSCGTCGRACTATNGTAGCASGACTVASCNAGYGNCDGAAANGCEVNLNTTVTSCGMCGRACTVANGTAGCASGSCTVAACNAGYADCNGNAADGCEVNLATDVNHCGACGARPTEVCDGRDNDCDGVVDDGCPLAPTILSVAMSLGAGGSGGSPSTLSCPAGYVVTGINVRSGGAVDAFGLLCGLPRLNVDDPAAPYQYVLSTSMETATAIAGGSGGTAYTHRCPADSVVTRVFGRAGGGVDAIGVACATVGVIGPPYHWNAVREVGSSPLYGGGGGTQFNFGTYNDPTVLLTGVEVRSGGGVDRLTFLFNHLGFTAR